MNFWQHLCECHFESRYFSAVVNICSKSQKFGNRSSVHARARWNLIWYDFRWLWIKIENWTSGHTDFFIFILWTFTLVLRWTFDNTYMNAILNLGTCQPLWTFAVTFRNLEIDPACTRVRARARVCTLESHLIQYQVVVNKNWKLVVWAHWFFYFYSLNFYFRA